MPATLTVIDLTSALGLHAIKGLRPAAQPDASWRQLRLSGLSRPACLDWLRTSASGGLPLVAPDTAGLFVIAGPGSASRLPGVVQAARASNPRGFWILLAPNAIVEEWTLRDLPQAPTADGEPAWRTWRLPTSDPQALWLILMEQFDSLLRHHAGPDDPLIDPDSEKQAMNSTLNQCLEAAMAIEGAMAVSLVDYRSGMSLGAKGSGLNLDLAAAGNSEVVRAKLRTAESLGFRGGIEDILITLPQQYHLIRLTPTQAGLFLYLVLDRQRGNLALARYKLAEIERAIKV
jgi:hypothetical protein